MSQFSPRMVLHRTMAGQRTKDHGKISKGTLKRIWGFASKRKTMLFLFLGLSVVISVIGVITPVLAGDVVNAITSGARSKQSFGSLSRSQHSRSPMPASAC